ncbi:uncharacterized protein [Watersipora subatra]|uniref:uncharacterized protein n=1 Tax=Watersipora subatra TaxID=2589382 RepID=UPI00355C972C
MNVTGISKEEEKSQVCNLLKETTDEVIKDHQLVIKKESCDRKVSEHKRRLEVFQQRCAQLQKAVLENEVNLEAGKLKMKREHERFLAGLPMYSYQNEIMKTISESQVSIVVGDTGSGKSTQVCQYLYEHGFANDNHKIFCTQPRKVAAMSLAERVSTEMKTALGNLVGYQVGMKGKVSNETKIVFSTDHCLLNECLKDRLFLQYSVLVIDEAHERSIFTDLLLGLIKKCLPQRPDLKVIITSATIDPAVFQKYFDDCPVVRVLGRMYHVDVSYSHGSLPCAGVYLQFVLDCVKQLHAEKEPGNILAFLVTPFDCERGTDELADLVGAVCFPLHGQLSAEKYAEVMAPITDGRRKVVLATNCAESSITIPGIKYVVDCGLAKEKQFDPKVNVSKLVICRISKSSADQRKGRAGRVASGECIRLYSEHDYQSMEEIAVPEILRVNLGQAVLSLIALGIKDPLSFDFVQIPDKQSLKSAHALLKSLGCLDIDGGLSDIGKKMVHLPVDPKFAKFILLCCDHGVGYTGIAMAAMCIQGNMVFYRGSNDDENLAADAKKAKFLDSRGDSFTFLKLFFSWLSQPAHSRGQWCFENSINATFMENAYSLIIELRKCLNHHLDIEVEEDTWLLDNLEAIQTHYLACFSPDNLCFFSGSDIIGYFVPQVQEYCRLHPSSALSYSGETPKIAIFEKILETSQKYLITVSKIDQVNYNYDGGRLNEVYSEHVVKEYPLSNGGCSIQHAIHDKRCTIIDDVKRKFSSLLLIPRLRCSKSEEESKWVNLIVRHSDYQVVNGYIQTNFVAPLIDAERQKKKEIGKGGKSDVKVYLGAGAQIDSSMMPSQFTFVKVVTERDCANLQASSEKKLELQSDFEPSIAIEWLRRPIKRQAFLNFRTDFLDQIGFITEDIMLNGTVCKAVRHTNDCNSLFLTPIPKDCTESMIKDNMPTDLQPGEPRISLLFEAAKFSIKKDHDTIKKLLDERLQATGLTSMSIEFLDDKEKCRFVRCFIKMDPSVTQAAALKSLHRLTYQSRCMNLTASWTYRFAITVRVYKHFQQDIHQIATKSNSTVDFKVVPMHKKVGILNCRSKCRETLERLQTEISQIVYKVSFDCNDPLSKLLLFMATLQTKNERRQLIEFLKTPDSEHRMERVLPLKGGDKPPGLMKLILRRYRVDLHDIEGCDSVRLDLRKHEIQYLGTSDGYYAIQSKLVNLEQEVIDRSNSMVEDQCPICLNRFEEEKVQLSVCGHYYCKECFDGWMKIAIKYRHFPLCCTAKDCNERLCIDDVPITNELINASVESFVSQNKEYKFCPTPDCPNVYRTIKTSSTYCCTTCSVRTCTCCHKNAHLLTEACLADPDSNSISRWMAEDPENRQKCPGCGFGIEKNEGCLHMHCTKCNAHFCWNCLTVYSSESVVYRHVCPGRTGHPQ